MTVTFLSATELAAATLPAETPILAPILSTKSLALLYGPRGLGKTFVALGIARAAASGASFLGWRAPRPHRVLYIDGEMAAVDMRSGWRASARRRRSSVSCWPISTAGPCSISRTATASSG